MLIPVLCCCVCWVSPCMARMWQQLRADEGGHPQHSLPGAQSAALSLLGAARFSREVVPEQPNEINHLILALRTWPWLSTGVPVWKGQWCKWCGLKVGGRWWWWVVGGGANTFQRSVQHVPLQLRGPRDQKAMLRHTLQARRDVSICSSACAWKRWMGVCVTGM